MVNKKGGLSIVMIQNPPFRFLLAGVAKRKTLASLLAGVFFCRC